MRLQVDSYSGWTTPQPTSSVQFGKEIVPEHRILFRSVEDEVNPSLTLSAAAAVNQGALHMAS